MKFKNTIIAVLSFVLCLSIAFAAPSVSDVEITSNNYSDILNSNLTCEYTPNIDTTTSAVAWALNGNNINYLYYPFEGNSSNALLDYSGDLNINLTNTNAVWNSTGGVDGTGGFEFNGVDSILSGGQDVLEQKYVVGVSLWFKTSNYDYNTQLIGQGRGFGSSFNSFQIAARPADYIEFRVRNSTSVSRITSLNPVGDNNWHHVVGIYNNETLKLYLDNVLQGTLNHTGMTRDTTDAFEIGENNGIYYNGSIDDIIVFYRDISADEVEALYNNGTNKIVSSSLVYNDNYTCTVTPFNASAVGTSVTSPIFNVVNSTPADELWVNISYPPNTTIFDEDAEVPIAIDFYNDTAIDSIYALITLPNSTVINKSDFDLGLGNDFFNTDTEDINWELSSITEPGQTCYADIDTTVSSQLYFNVDGAGIPSTVQCGYSSLKLVKGDYDTNISFNISEMDIDTFFTFRTAPTDSLFGVGKRAYIAVEKQGDGSIINRFAFFNGTTTTIQEVTTNDTVGHLRIERFNSTKTNVIYRLYYKDSDDTVWNNVLGNISIPNAEYLQYIQFKPGSGGDTYGKINLTLDSFSMVRDEKYFTVFNQTEASGTYNFTVHINDTNGLTNSTSGNFNITPINDIPSRPFIEEPDVGDSVYSYSTIRWGQVFDEENDNIKFNITLLYPNGSKHSDIVTEYGNINSTSFLWDTTTTDNGNYKISVTAYESDTVEKNSNTDTLAGTFTVNNQETAFAIFSDVVGGVLLDDPSYHTIYSLNKTVVQNTSYSITIPVTLEKTKEAGSQVNSIYYRTIVNGVPEDEKLIVTVDTLGEIRSGFYNSRVTLTNGSNIVDIQIRSENGGGDHEVTLQDSTLNVYGIETLGGVLYNGQVFDNQIINVVGDGTYKNVISGSLPFGVQSRNVFVRFVGSVENNGTTNPNTINLKISDGVTESNNLSRYITDDVGGVYIGHVFSGSSNTTFTLEANGDENFTLKGDFYVFDLADTTNAVVGYNQITNINSTISPVNVVGDSFILTSSLSYNPSNGDLLNYTNYIKNLNTSVYNYSTSILRNFDSSAVGTLGNFYKFIGNSSYSYEVGSNYTITGGSGTIDYFNLILFQTTELDFTLDTLKNITINIDQANGTYIGNVSGTCDSDKIITSLIINDSDFTNTGSNTVFNFEYNGLDSEHIAVSITCVDQYLNSETVLANFKADSVDPSCDVADYGYLFDINDENPSVIHELDFTCADNIEIASINVSCDNGFVDNVAVGTDIYNYLNSTNISETTICSIDVTDNAGNTNNYSSTISYTQDPDTIYLRTANDMDGRLTAFVCPTNQIQYGVLVGFFVLAFVFYGMGLKFKTMLRPIFAFMGGLLMAILPFYVIGCDLVLAIIVWVASLAMMLSCLVLPFNRSNDDDY